MRSLSLCRVVALFGVLSLLACERKIEGPAPAVTEVTPNAVCRDQRTTTIVVRGSGLSPLVSQGLENTPRVNLPSVTLLHARSIADTAGSGKEVVIPDDAANAADSRVRWQSQTELHFDFFPELQAESGLYTVRIANKNGQSTELADALLAVPRPTLTQVDPEVRCSDEGTNVVLTGDFFLKQGDKLPTVKLGSVELKASNMTECRKLPGSSGIEACKKAVVEIPVNTLQPGQYPVVLTNPSTVSCASTETVTLTMVPRPTLTEVRPDLVCTEQGANTVVATGTGFLRVDGVGPALLLGQSSFPLTLTNCQPVAGPVRTTVESCTTGTASLPQSALATGLHAASVKNPEPAACASVEAVNVAVVPPPTVTQIEPELICTAEGNNTVVVTGTGFLDVSGTLPELVIGTTAYPTTLSNCTSISGLKNQNAQSCTTATAVVPQGSLTAAVYAAKIVNPAPAGCESKESVSFVVAAPPTVTSIQPDLACGENPNTVVVTGTGLLQVDSATPQLLIGTATLTTTLSNCTDVVGPARIALKSCTTATATLGGMTLPPGDYAVKVVNPATAACQSTQNLRFAVTPPPVISAVTPDLVCIAEGARAVTLTGTGFIRIGSTLPTITAGAATVTVTAASSCTTIAGTTTGAESCTSLSATVSQGATAGLLDMRVQNPGAGCLSTAKKFDVAADPTLLGANPPGLCATATAPVPVELEGSGLLRASGAQPTVFIQQSDGGLLATLSATVDGGSCTSVTGLSSSVDSCSLAYVTVPNTLPQGNHSLYLTNPQTAACTSNPVPFNVALPPTLTGTTPSKVCAQGGFVDLTGTNFVPGMTVRLLSPSPVDADQPVTVNANGTAARASFTGPLQTGGPYSLEVLTGGGGCTTTLSAQLTVTNGPVVFFVDPNVIFNGITTQGTVYASGFTSSGLEVRIRLNGAAADGGSNPEILVSSSFNPTKANRINFVAPAGLSPGSYDVLVRDDATSLCPGVLLNAFKVTDQLTLTLTAIDPPFGHSGSDTAVTVFADAGTLADGGTSGFLPLPRFYLNPAMDGGIAVPLESVALIDPSRSTAVVPTGQTVGTYSVIAVNPSGAVGLLPGAFRIVPDPLVEIDAVSPGSLLLNTANQPFTATGRNIRANATVAFRCIDATVANPAVVSVAATSIVVAADGLSLSGQFSNTFSNQQACVVRVTNTDNTYGDFSSVVLTNPAQKLTIFRAGFAMNLARRALVTEAGAATRAAQFVYGIGGDDGAAVHDTVESAPLDLFGNPGAYFTQRYRLTTPRTLGAGQRVGRFLYVGGGRGALGVSGAVLSSVERAYLLNPADRVEITDADFNVVEGAGGLASGVYYYRVAAVLDGTSALNPAGENLPSDPFPISVPALQGGAALTLTIRWSTTPGAAMYRVYRSVNPNDAAGAELLIAELPAGAGAPSFTDNGSVVPGSVGATGLRPLPIGSTGVWTVVGTLPNATSTGALGREGLAAATAVDSANASLVHLYFTGGKDPAGALLNTYVRFPVALGAGNTQAVGTPVPGATTFATARWQHAALSANSVNAPSVGSAQYLYILGGLGATGATSSLQVASIGPGGVLGTFSATAGMNPARAGFGHAIANDFLFGFGAAGAAPDSSTAAAQIGDGAATPPDVGNWSSGAATMQRKRYLMGSTLHGAFIYLQGGQTDTEAATRSTEQIIW